MKIYLAGTSVSTPEKEKHLQLLFSDSNKLHSYFHCVDGFEKKWFKMNIKNKVNLFLDSGAFSAKTQGTEINIQDYISFIKENEEFIDVYANLDVIGNAKDTYKNQRIMEKAGLKPIPVFHYGENIKWLERYLSKNYDYIALGGMVKTTGLTSWLDNIWNNYLTDEKGFPKCKVHGFGLTNILMMYRYPWYSVDSTSWVVTGRLGAIYVPRFEKGKWIYNKNPLKIDISTKSPRLKEDGKHLNTLSTLQQKQILKYLDEKGFELGKSEFKKEKQDYILKENERWGENKPKEKSKKREVEIIVKPGVSNKYQLRDEINIIYFQDLEKMFPTYPWAIKKMKGLF